MLYFRYGESLTPPLFTQLHYSYVAVVQNKSSKSSLFYCFYLTVLTYLAVCKRYPVAICRILKNCCKFLQIGSCRIVVRHKFIVNFDLCNGSNIQKGYFSRICFAIKYRLPFRTLWGSSVCTTYFGS